MKKFLFLAACLFVASGCEKENNAPTPQQVFLAYLSGAEISPISNPYGTAEGVYNADSNYLKLRLKSDLLRPINWHLIIEEPDEAGGEKVVFDLGKDYSHIFGTGVTLTEEQERELMEGKYYVEVRSDELPGGMVRGQLTARR